MFYDKMCKVYGESSLAVDTYSKFIDLMDISTDKYFDIVIQTMIMHPISNHALN